ncbi:NAD(P)/FAD-dependent oxidoreductase [Solirubrobacter soli]|uniref:NAD(P)/FAD-dependent oxidoreductase n=1 Tax=Solirubrobacter soli TaxID=363832 RepID=UPI0004138772|nr:NAD(P)/FAD-dependent oxidoreductase [Solirubrobacter soli]
MDFDCIVVGAGPAGLSAALTLGRARRTVLVLDSGEPRNHAARAMHGVLGHDGLSPAELRRRGIEEVARYGAEVRPAAVSAARAIEGGFELDGITASTIVLATGLLDATPDVPGFEAIYGISAHTCPYCDGWEHRDERIAVYAGAEAAAHMGPLLRQWSADTIVLDPAQVTRFVHRDGHLTHVELADGTSLERDALFFNVAMHPRVDLAVQLGCELTEAGFIASAAQDRKTTVDGVYAVGNCADPMLNVPMSIADGARAAVFINVHLLVADGILHV